MPRRRHRYRNWRFAKANNVWLPDMWDTKIGKGGSDGTDTTIEQEDIYKIHDLTVPDTDFETTLERIRGQIQTFQTGSQATNAVLYGYVHNNNALADAKDGTRVQEQGMASPYGVVDPFDPGQQQDIPIIIDACAPTSSGSQTTVGPNLAVDVKSKRKVEKHQFLTLLVKIVHLLQSPQAQDILTFIGAVRSLYRFKL